MIYSVVSGVASTAYSFIPILGRTTTSNEDKDTSSGFNGDDDDLNSVLYKSPNSIPTTASLVLHRLATTSPLLPQHLAELITALSVAARVSLRASALFAEVILEGARLGTGAYLGISRRALIAALGSARWIREKTSGRTVEEDKFLQVLDHYTNLGIYMVHHAFTLGELFTMSGFYIASSTVNISLTAGEESVKMLDSLFGSNETSRALSAFISLLGREWNSGKFSNVHGRGVLGTGRKFFSLTKSLTVWACLQSVTHRRTVKGMNMKVLWDCTVFTREDVNENAEKDEGEEDGALGNVAGTPVGVGGQAQRGRIISDVRSAREFGRTWMDEMSDETRERRISRAFPASNMSAQTFGATPTAMVSLTGGNSKLETDISDSEEETEIVYELMQLIGDDDEAEVKIEDLPEDVREALSRLESGDETGLEVVKRGDGMDGIRIARSKELGAMYEIETTTTVTTTTTVVRIVGEGESSPSRSKIDELQSPVPSTSRAGAIRRHSHQLNRSSSQVGSDNFRISSILEESEWVDVSSTFSQSEPNPTILINSIDQKSRPTSIADASRIEMCENPEQGKQKLGMLVKTMTKRLSSTTKTMRKITMSSKSQNATNGTGTGKRATHKKKNNNFVVTDSDVESSSSSTAFITAPPSPEEIERPNGTFKGALNKARRTLSRKTSATDLHKTARKSYHRQSHQENDNSNLTIPFPSSGTETPTSPRSSFASESSLTEAEEGEDTVSEIFGNPNFGTQAPLVREPSTVAGSIRSGFTSTSRTHLETTAKGEDDGMHSFWPCDHLVANVQRFMKYSSAAYGQHFMRILGIGSFPDKAFPTTSRHSHNHWAFAWHTKLSVDDILLSSYSENERFNNKKLSPLVHYVSVDHEIKAVVLTMRGTIGLSDVLVDLTCEYDNISVDGADPDGIYRVHSGMWHSALLLRSGTVRDVVKAALEDHPDYGVVLTGHSLGGGTAALLSLIWASPAHTFLNEKQAKLDKDGIELEHPQIRTEFVTSISSGLPAGRPIMAYCYGIPAVTSKDLSNYSKGLITSVIHGWDIVPTLSLGLFRDLINVAVNLAEEGNLAEEIVGRVIGIYQRRNPHKTTGIPDQDAPPALTDLDPSTRDVKLSKAEIISGRARNQATLPSYQDPALIHPVDEDMELNNWFYSLMKTLRASNDNEKLYPPGEVYIVEQHDCYISEKEENDGIRQRLEKVAGKRILLRYCGNVEARFSEPVFCRSMLLDHSPSSYEVACDLLAKAVRPQT